ncbi:MAG TPA: hypothetical protein VK698_03215 [Kofleriaceae bacterium]|nr:hypothetical protein [Kofleriaceae bacterium]
MTGSRGRHSALLDARAGADQDAPPVVCRKLRTKLAFGALEGSEDWRHGESSTAVYWCLRTMETVGPDDSFSHPHHCQRGRACFTAPDGDELVASADRPPSNTRST